MIIADEGDLRQALFSHLLHYWVVVRRRETLVVVMVEVTTIDYVMIHKLLVFGAGIMISFARWKLPLVLLVRTCCHKSLLKGNAILVIFWIFITLQKLVGYPRWELLIKVFAKNIELSVVLMTLSLIHQFNSLRIVHLIYKQLNSSD